MIYVFDTSSLRALQHYFPTVFKTIWSGLEVLVKENRLVSTREAWNELKNQSVTDAVLAWMKQHKQIFLTPDADELKFVATIFQMAHFQSLIGERQRLKGMPVADPFIIACAKIKNGTVVTEEQYKPNAAKIPNVCEHFQIPCINLETLMRQQGWSF